jgi:trigger factor
VVDLALERFVQAERLNLGTPLPKVDENFLGMLKIGFEYEIGLVPDFTLDLEAKTYCEIHRFC